MHCSMITKKTQGQHFDLAIDLVWLYLLTKPLYVLTLFYGWVGNFPGSPS